MIFIFGWLKETKSVRSTDCYCYHCQRKRTWDLWRETEWVTFFAVKTIPFLWKNFIECSGCGDTVRLNDARYKQVSQGRASAELLAFLEEHQLSQKNELQRNFLRSIRAQGEARE